MTRKKSIGPQSHSPTYFSQMHPSHASKPDEVGFENKLNLCSLAKLETLLGTGRVQLRLIATRAGSFYRPFPKKEKTRPFQKKFGAAKKPPRKIDNPEGDLKILQKKIYKALLKPLIFPHYLCGGVPGRTVLDNVFMHLDAPFLVTLDIKKFFRRITTFQVFRVWNKVLNCSPRISAILTRLTTFERHLPQGAPTSSLIANLVLFSVDREIRDECQREGVTYSTWVDDLAFSGTTPSTVISVAVQCLHNAGFSVSHKKLKRMGPGTRKVLNGVLLNRFPGVLPERLGQLRSGIHKLKNGEVDHDEMEKYISRLQGGIAHVTSIDPRKGARLRNRLGQAIAELAK
jgi:retron-type reverse transcriptase